MSSPLDCAALDLRGALDFAIMIEEDAESRYAELSRLLGDDPGGAGDVFRAMVASEREHRRALVARREALFRGAPPRVEISVADDCVEGPEVGDGELPRSAREALEVALAAEQRAHAFYGAILPRAEVPAVRAFFAQLQQEEAAHASLLAERIAALGVDPAVGDGGPRPDRAAGAAPPAETYEDRQHLEAALPRFDAATQAVAVRVVVQGLSHEDVAAALGVSRRTVARKLAGFLAFARRQVAVGVAAASLAGCAGSLSQPAGPGAGSAPGPRHGSWADRDGPAITAERATGRPPDHRSAPAAAVHAQVAARMRAHDRQVHERVTRAILSEAKLAALDPLLVVALIHVESSFDPRAVSSAGAVGLMQLLEPTMRRELERSRLPSADPRDPVANVQAGVRYLRRLIDAFGDVDVALMAYNAGPNRIRGHLRRGEIPARFHAYPRKVNGELVQLRSRLEGAAPRPSLAVTEEPRPGPAGRRSGA